MWVMTYQLFVTCSSLNHSNILPILFARFDETYTYELKHTHLVVYMGV